MLYFAYGSNMNRRVMARHCPHARAIGRARLDHWRLVFASHGYASIAPASGAAVHGVLWRVSARDLAALDAYESVASGLYARRTLSVICDSGRAPAHVYVAGERGRGRPRAGQLDLVIAGARDFGLPADYVECVKRLARRAPAFGTLERGEP